MEWLPVSYPDERFRCTTAAYKDDPRWQVMPEYQDDCDREIQVPIPGLEQEMKNMQLKRSDEGDTQVHHLTKAKLHLRRARSVQTENQPQGGVNKTVTYGTPRDSRQCEIVVGVVDRKCRKTKSRREILDHHSATYDADGKSSKAIYLGGRNSVISEKPNKGTNRL
jgi:hypothetical protein